MKTPNDASLITSADALNRLARSVDGQSTCGRSFIFLENELLEVAEFLKSIVRNNERVSA